MEKTYKELAVLFAESAKVGELLQHSNISPSDALATLLITAGRLLAREGYSDMSIDDAWNAFLNEHSRELFNWGHKEERDRGHYGTPRKNVPC